MVCSIQVRSNHRLLLMPIGATVRPRDKSSYHYRGITGIISSGETGSWYQNVELQSILGEWLNTVYPVARRVVAIQPCASGLGPSDQLGLSWVC